MKSSSTFLVLIMASLLVAGNAIAQTDIVHSRGEVESPASTTSCQCVLYASDRQRVVPFAKACWADKGRIRPQPQNSKTKSGVICKKLGGSPKSACGMLDLEVTCNP